MPVGSLDPDSIDLPEIYVDRVVQAEDMRKRIDHLTVNHGGEVDMQAKTPQDRADRVRIVKRAAREIKEGMHVNLGIGIPTFCANFLAPGANVTF